MVWLAQMTFEEQHRQQNGPGSEGLPGYVIVGPGPWYMDDDDEWQVDPEAARQSETVRATPTRPWDRA
ncbi:MAG: hypothetical protein H0V37_01260 [Chloroflexia bacterium]|nr:hypothetical protein [Chloroflexia bacterium]